MCEPHLNTLAHTLPFAHCSQSRLVCTISGAALNENNQPMMLPNGEETSSLLEFLYFDIDTAINKKYVAEHKFGEGGHIF